jgi:DNA-binding NarL/FixJ family response regulator
MKPFEKIAIEYDLTAKEKTILYCILHGCSNKEISEKIFYCNWYS